MAESSTRRATSFSSSRCRRSRIWRLVTRTCLPCRQTGIVDGEGHLNGRIVDLNKGQRLNLAGVAHGVADGNIGQTGKGNRSPEPACSMGSRPFALKSNSLVMRPVMCRSGLCQSQT